MGLFDLLLVSGDHSPPFFRHSRSCGKKKVLDTIHRRFERARVSFFPRVNARTCPLIVTHRRKIKDEKLTRYLCWFLRLARHCKPRVLKKFLRNVSRCNWIAKTYARDFKTSHASSKFVEGEFIWLSYSLTLGNSCFFIRDFSRQAFSSLRNGTVFGRLL